MELKLSLMFLSLVIDIYKFYFYSVLVVSVSVCAFKKVSIVRHVVAGSKPAQLHHRIHQAQGQVPLQIYQNSIRPAQSRLENFKYNYIQKYFDVLR